jgi:hypothetical protein
VKAVGHVAAFDRQLDEVVLGDFETIRVEAILPRGDRELAPVRRLVLREEADENPATEQAPVPRRISPRVRRVSVILLV